MANPLISDRFIEFLLYEVLDAEALIELPAFAEHEKDTFDLILASARKLARDALYPAYRIMDQEPPRFVDGRVLVHPKMHELLPRLVELDLARAQRPVSVGGMALPHTVATLAMTYLAAANLSAGGYTMLTAGAAHLIEAFGSEHLREMYMRRMMEGKWMGTMALTEPHAGSSLADVTTSAAAYEDGSYRIRGSKIFISGGDQDLTENIVHLVLARIQGAPLGTKGISLFVVPRMRPGAGDELVFNDVHTTGVLHKIGWRGLPSVALSFGDNHDCHGWLVGEAHRGLTYMFQMMNEARILVGLQAASTASVAYLEALEYARARPQGRGAASRDPRSPQVAIIEHADVRRMLLRQKAIVEGSLALLGRTARYVDISHHGASPEARSRASLVCDLLTPIAKTFPSEYGFEANALAVQIHGGYGYTSEYPVEAWLRDQKLNTIHEGTSGIHSLDLLGRKVMAGGGAALQALAEEIADTSNRAREAGVDDALCNAVGAAVARLGEVTMLLGAKGLAGDVEGMLLHSVDYLTAMSLIVIAWQWLDLARCARIHLQSENLDQRAFAEGQGYAARYWIHTELPRALSLLDLAASGEDSYTKVSEASF